MDIDYEAYDSDKQPTNSSLSSLTVKNSSETNSATANTKGKSKANEKVHYADLFSERLKYIILRFHSSWYRLPGRRHVHHSLYDYRVFALGPIYILFIFMELDNRTGVLLYFRICRIFLVY